MLLRSCGVNRGRLLVRLADGAVQNVAFVDMINLIKGFGFTLARMNGSHYVFSRDDIPELINIQNVGGQAKPYQIRQFLHLVEKYNLKLEEK
jgi:predicted RNA binding protein YcfA (HicA-like mRNA interferase family)